jgi:hypothetical protein
MFHGRQNGEVEVGGALDHLECTLSLVTLGQRLPLRGTVLSPKLSWLLASSDLLPGVLRPEIWLVLFSLFGL